MSSVYRHTDTGPKRMTEAKGGYAPYGKTGSGTYGSSLGKQTGTVIDPVRERVLDLVKSIPFTDTKSVFNIGDYGTADGAASMNFIRDLISTLKEHHGHEVEFRIIYEDQEINDFNSLFKRLSGIIPVPTSYLLELDNVYPLASGINFHKQCVPTDTMHFIMCMIAVQWLSKLPVLYKESMHIYPDSSADEKKAFYNQARADWETFLLMRSKELSHGGVLLVASTGEYETNNGTIIFNAKTFFLILTHIWRSFRDSGRITSEEFLNTNFRVCDYSLKQLREPFDDESSLVSKAGLRLLSAEVMSRKCVFYSDWKDKKDVTGVDDREEFARKYVEAHRNWSHNGIISGLSDERSQKEKQEILDEVFQMAKKQIVDMNPEQFKDDYVVCYVVIRKE